MLGALSLESTKLRLAFAAVALALLIAGALLVMQPAESPSGANAAPSESESPVPADLRARVDRWIADRGLNPYGDPMQTRYPGGNPLFDARTGHRRDRYEYILERHPDLRRPAP